MDSIMVSYDIAGKSSNRCFAKSDVGKALKFIRENRANWDSFSTFEYASGQGITELTPIILLDLLNAQ